LTITPEFDEVEESINDTNDVSNKKLEETSNSTSARTQATNKALNEKEINMPVFNILAN
jgi:hypothetical protein